MFQKNIITLNSIETSENKVIEYFDSNKYYEGLFVNLKKAFDNVDHRIFFLNFKFNFLKKI